MSARDYALRVLEKQEDIESDDVEIESSRAFRVANLHKMLNRLTSAEQKAREAGEQLELERMQLRVIFDCIEQPITVVDLYNKQILFHNETFEEMVGDVADNATCHSLIYGCTEVCEQCPFASEPVDKTSAYSFENYSEPLDRWFYCLHKYILWPNGETREAIFSLAIDITDRKIVEAELRKSEMKFSKAFFNSPIPGGITTASEGEFIEINDAFIKFTGYTRKDAIGKTVFDLQFYHNVQDRINIMNMLETDGHVSGYDLWIRRKDGRLCLGSMHVEVLDDQDDMQLLSVIVDTTDKRYLEIAYNAATECSLQGLSIYSEEGTIFANNRFYEILGITKEQAESESLSESLLHIYDSDRKKSADRIRRMLNGEHIEEQTELRYVKPDGTIIWLEARSRFIDYHGRNAIQTVFQDVTKIKQLEEELCKLRKMRREVDGV